MNITLKNYSGPVQYKRWRRGDPYPQWSSEVGIDTETELITATNLTPPLVVMGVYNQLDNTTYIANWEDAPDLLGDILKRDILMYFANVGFDYFELACQELTDATARNKVVDILLRAALKDISTIGFITTYSLVDVCKHYLDYDMNKHEDQGDKAARVTFRRDTPVTEEQLEYLAIDCMTAYYAGVIMGKQPTETANTRGAVVLYHISKNGLYVDRPIFDHFRDLLVEKKEQFRQELLTYGFPDPELKNAPAESVVIENNWKKFVYKWFDKIVGNHANVVTNVPTKTTARRALVYLVYVMENGGVLQEFAKYLAIILQEQKKALSKKEVAHYNALAEKYELESLDTTIKRAVWPNMLECILNAAAEHKTIPECFQAFDALMQEHQDWWVKPVPVSPQKFLQAHLAELEKQYPGLVFDRTEKSQQLKCSKADAWKLSDAGCKDPFLISYINYIHFQKYLSTYLNPEFIRPDGRVRTKFGMVTTARTSSTKPNVQNLPSRGDLPLKNMYKPEEGLFCSTDFSFAELVALAENCIQKYGFSVLGQIINADVCPHYFFAGVMLGKIKADVSFCSDPEKVAEMVEFLHKNVTKQERQLAKASKVSVPTAGDCCCKRK